MTAAALGAGGNLTQMDYSISSAIMEIEQSILASSGSRPMCAGFPQRELDDRLRRIQDILR